MSIFKGLGRRVLSALWTRGEDWMDRDPATRLVKESWTGGPTAAGVAVNAQTAMNYSAVWAAVQVISAAVASLPMKVYRRKAEGREEITSGDLVWALREEPSKDLTPYTFKETPPRSPPRDYRAKSCARSRSCAAPAS